MSYRLQIESVKLTKFILLSVFGILYKYAF
nr:MAG TPA: hypothetical protein [Caudoviricetes sp.]